MEKPLTIRINEFKNKICEVVNESKLPAYILLNEFHNYAEEIKMQDNILIEEYYRSLESKGSEEKCKK